MTPLIGIAEVAKLLAVRVSWCANRDEFYSEP
jgi:hypothetical protein